MSKTDKNIEAVLASELRRYAINGEFSTRRVVQELQELKIYLEAMEGFIEKEDENENLEYRLAQETASALSSEQQDAFWEWYDGSAYHWAQSFASHLRASFITGLVTLAERFLKELCSDLRRIQPDNFPIHETELVGKLHERMRKYLATFGKVDGMDEQWKKLANIYFIRNAIVHDGCELIAKADTISKHRKKGTLLEYWERKRQEFATTYPDLELNSHEIVLSRDYCARAAKEIEEFFAALEHEKSKRAHTATPHSI